MSPSENRPTQMNAPKHQRGM